MEEKINLDRTLKIKIIRVLSSDLFIFSSIIDSFFNSLLKFINVNMYSVLINQLAT